MWFGVKVNNVAKFRAVMQRSFAVNEAIVKCCDKYKLQGKNIGPNGWLRNSNEEAKSRFIFIFTFAVMESKKKHTISFSVHNSVIYAHLDKMV